MILKYKHRPSWFLPLHQWLPRGIPSARRETLTVDDSPLAGAYVHAIRLPSSPNRAPVADCVMFSDYDLSKRHSSFNFALVRDIQECVTIGW